MADQRDHGRQNTHDTGSAQSRARDDLRTGSKKIKPNDTRNENRDRDEKKPADARESNEPEVIAEE